ncbi:MAG: LysM peptidoglycan-binding domain-containing protein, partial [Clostridia bacterium]|nr:LysM peptidoglycan-binding domain-containing protein [Clostridia bacterium]
ETGSADTMTFNIPFTQVIDVQGISSDSVNDIMLEVMSYDASLKSEYDENSTLVTLDARICATVTAAEDGETEIVDDAYSTMYESELITKQCRITRLPVITEKDISVKSDVTTGENGITRITDMWCDTVSSITSVENDCITVKGKLLCCIFAADGDGVPFYVERPVEFSYSPEITGNVKDMSVKLNVQPLSLSFRITGDNTVEIKAELRICISAAESCVCRVVTSAAYNEDKPRIKDKTAALTLYYADEGENLWSIARSYCTSVEAIKLENELDDDTVQSRNMLLIPM